MHSAWLVQHLWPLTVGGVELQMDAVSAYFRRRGHDVTLWTAALPRASRKVLPDGRTVIGFGTGHVPAPFWRINALWKFAQAYRHVPSPRGVDVVFSPDPLLATAHLLRGTGVPVVYCPGGTVVGSTPWDGSPRPPKSRWRRVVATATTPLGQYLAAERFALQRAAGIIAVSEPVRRQMLQAHPGCAGRIRVVYNGYEPADFRRKVWSADSAQAANGPVPFTCICVARLHPIKNLPHLLQAWALVRHPAKRLWLVGEGGERAALEELTRRLRLEESVEFLGERRDVPDLLVQADVLVLPSRYEACGMAVIEAMGAGLPVITSRNSPGLAEVGASEGVNVDGVTGYLVDPCRPEDLARRLDELATDPALRRRLGDAAYELAASHFTWEQAARAYLAVAERVLGWERT